LQGRSKPLQFRDTFGDARGVRWISNWKNGFVFGHGFLLLDPSNAIEAVFYVLQASDEIRNARPSID